jgi:hypothetical protein
MLDVSQVLLGVLSIWALLCTLLLLSYHRTLRRLWREPVFRWPVLVVESDDWGAGPLIQAEALRDIAAVLSRHTDASGRFPTFNLALVLAVPDGPAIEKGGAYRRVELDAAQFRPILTELLEGQARGVFALQLHGMEHYWPQALMASEDAAVQAWLRQSVPATTEQLPSALQSRWVNAACLPSTRHPDDAISGAVAEEVRAYRRIFGSAPAVVVPPTFVWTCATERAWADEGIQYIVSPGWRYTCRDAQGLPGGDEGPIVNGDRSSGLTCLARNDYFEPWRGRDANHALRALSVAISQGRPCLLENHRDNFIVDLQRRQQSLAELDKLYRDALRCHDDLRFLSSSDLGAVLRTHDPQWLILEAGKRLPFFWQRLRDTGHLWRFMRLAGLSAMGHLMLPTSGTASSGTGRQKRS